MKTGAEDRPPDDVKSPANGENPPGSADESVFRAPSHPYLPNLAPARIW